MDTHESGHGPGTRNNGRACKMNGKLPRVFVALDFSNPIHALGLVDRLEPGSCGLKVGKELFVSAGPEPVRWMVERGFAVFLDRVVPQLRHPYTIHYAAYRDTVT